MPYDSQAAAPPVPDDIYRLALTVSKKIATLSTKSFEQLMCFSRFGKLLVLEGDHYALELTALKLAHLRTFLQVSVVEGILRRLVAGADPPQFWQARLREYNEYFVLAKAPPGGSAELNQTTLHWARVPDTAGRRVVAAFTAQDALQNFVAVGGVGDGRVSVRLDGRMFWAHGNSNASLHGVVFNPAGPGEPIPLAREIAQAVLGA